ncbi:TPA: histidine phosphatase family protein, partial [Streptococcus agalactiae]
MKFYLVRHGKTQWNLEGRFQGANGDSPLLEEAIEELEELGQYLSSIHF